MNTEPFTAINAEHGVQFVETRGQGRRVVLVKQSPDGKVREAVAVLATSKQEARTLINALRCMVGDLPDGAA